MENIPNKSKNIVLKINREPKLGNVPLTVIVLIILFLGIYLYFFIDKTAINELVDVRLIFGQVSVIIVLGLTITYYFAYQFFKQRSFLFISVGWFTNSVYLISEFFFVDKCSIVSESFCESHSTSSSCLFDSNYCLNYSLMVFLFSLISTIFFYSAAVQKFEDNEDEISEEYSNKNSSKFKNLILYLERIHIIIWAVISILPIIILLIFDFSQLISSPYTYIFAIATIPGVLFTSYSLSLLGLKISDFVSEMTNKDKGSKKLLSLKLLPYTFFLYGILQFVYPFKLFLQQTDTLFGLPLSFVIMPFIIALILKSANIWGMMGLMLRINYPKFIKTKYDLLNTRRLLYQKSNLAVLGLISASIEHDLKTPLANLQTDIKTIKTAFPNNNRLKKYIERLENDRYRIFATARIIPFIRASQDYFATDKFMEKISITEVINLAIRSVKIENRLNTEKFFFKNKNKDVFIRAFPPMIQQVISNIFKNSIEAIIEKGDNKGEIKIDIQTLETLPPEVTEENKHINTGVYETWIKVSISDEGCGISEENIGKLTTTYSSKDKPNGGIGLFIAKRLLKIHDAAIIFNSVLNEGTTVSLFFPEWEAYNKAVENNLIGNEKSKTDQDEFEIIDVEELDFIQEIADLNKLLVLENSRDNTTEENKNGGTGTGNGSGT